LLLACPHCIKSDVYIDSLCMLALSLTRLCEEMDGWAEELVPSYKLMHFLFCINTHLQLQKLLRMLPTELIPEYKLMYSVLSYVLNPSVMVKFQLLPSTEWF